jgi:hypothetical protein
MAPSTHGCVTTEHLTIRPPKFLCMRKGMKQVELYRWWVRGPGRKRAHLTNFLMDAKTAEATHPGARADPTSRTLRQVPETDAEAAARQSVGQDGVQGIGK